MVFQNREPGGSFWIKRESPISWRYLRTLLLRVPFSSGLLKIAPNVSAVAPGRPSAEGFSKRSHKIPNTNKNHLFVDLKALNSCWERKLDVSEMRILDYAMYYCRQRR